MRFDSRVTPFKADFCSLKLKMRARRWFRCPDGTAALICVSVKEAFRGISHCAGFMHIFQAKQHISVIISRYLKYHGEVELAGF